MLARVHLLLPFLVLSVACGARATLEADDAAPIESEVVPTASAVFVAGDDGCASERPVESAAAALKAGDSGDDIAIVELFFAEELCTGLGGQYVLAREVEGFRELWLGGHGCQFFPPERTLEAPAFGVLRYSITAGLFQIPPDACVGFPDEPPGLESDAIARAAVFFSTLDDARRFAASLP